MPIDPVLAVVGDRASQSVYDAGYLELGLDRPLYRAVRDLRGRRGPGRSRHLDPDQARPRRGHRRVFPATLELATVGILIGTLIGVPIGVLAAVQQGRLIDQIVRVVGLIGYSMPIFWLGLVGLAGVLRQARLGRRAGPDRHLLRGFVHAAHRAPAARHRARRASGTCSGTRCSHIVLPASLLGYFSMAYISRMTRSFMLDQLGQEYVTTARVKGVPEWRVIWVHAFRQRRVPLITVIALSYACLLEGSVLTETVFAWPGLGQLPHQRAPERRHDRGAGRHAGHRGDLRQAQHAVGPALPLLDPRGGGAHDGAFAPRLAAERPAGVAACRRAWARPTGPGSRSGATRWRWSGS